MQSEEQKLHTMQSEEQRLTFRMLDVQVQNPPADDMSGVRNEHGGLALAIDDNTEAADVDDAVSVERTSDGKEWLRIHVADPGRWIALGSELDRYAASARFLISAGTALEHVPVQPGASVVLSTFH
eukprot:3935801-Rhodomonas_salina.2